MFGFESRIVRKMNAREKAQVEKLLEQHGLFFEGEPDRTVLVEDSAGNLIATASIQKKVIRMVAADPEWQEAGLAGVVISKILQYAREKDIFHLLVFTKPDMAEKFAAMGFAELARTEDAVFMESGRPGSADFCRMLDAEKLTPERKPVGAAVMNCNPFTRGHRYLIEQASSRCGAFYVIVVQEDASEFPFEDRIELVKNGTADLPNVRVVPSGDYAVSRSTFPTYFLKDKADSAVAGVQARLDVTLFTKIFVPALNIEIRFVGTEPYSRVTEIYNEAMREILPKHGVTLEIIPRLESGANAPISASKVREALRLGDVVLLEQLLPKVTLDYLASDRGRVAVAKLSEQTPQ